MAVHSFVSLTLADLLSLYNNRYWHVNKAVRLMGDRKEKELLSFAFAKGWRVFHVSKSEEKRKTKIIQARR